MRDLVDLLNGVSEDEARDDEDEDNAPEGTDEGLTEEEPEGFDEEAENAARYKALDDEWNELQEYYEAIDAAWNEHELHGKKPPAEAKALGSG